mgnify:CR=1 FL=1
MDMANLKEIAENIKKNKLDKALNLCDVYEDINNQHIISNFRGVIYLIKENLELSEKNFLKSLKINPKFEDAIKNLYLVYLKKKLFKDLLVYAKKLIEIDKLNAEHNFKLAYALELNNNLDESIKYYNIYIDLDGINKKQAFNNIGCMYLGRNKPKIANDFFLKGINFGEDKIIINNLLNSFIMLRDLENSDLYFEKAQKIDENFLDFKCNKARYLILKNQINEAIEILEHHQNVPQFLITLLILYSNLNKKDDRDKLLMTHKDKIKNDHKFYNYLALSSLYDGNFEDGWKYYEYRNSKTVDFFKNIKEWTGEKIISKNIVVFNEQGLGDSIQFSKYLIPLTKIAKNVTFVVQDNVKSLFNVKIKNLSVENLASCKNKQFDFKIAIGSLIKFFFKEKFDDHENLIRTNKNNDLKWKGKILNDKLNVGLVWSGGFNGPNEPYRSIPLKRLSKIFSLDAKFYCLQNEIWDRDKDDFKSSNLIDYSKYKLDEIASIIKNLDLVITSDTSILHLSASLNKETWAMLSLHPDWRWGKFNTINPYSSLKFFNQSKFNDWNDVEDSIFLELKDKIFNFKKLQ